MPSLTIQPSRILILLALTASLFGFAAAPPPHRVTDPAGFTLSIPGDFEVIGQTELKAASPDFLHGFRRIPSAAQPPAASGSEGDFPAFLFIEKLRGMIGRERLNPADLPKGSAARVFTTRWKDFEIDAMEIPETLEGASVITFNAQVPLKPFAVQVKVIGPAAHKAELLKLLNAALAGLDGNTNWKASVIPMSISNSPSYGTILLIVAIVVMVVALVALWFIGRKTPRGTVLAIAACAYVLSYAIPPSNIRELYMVTGGLRMFGVIAGILGLIDAFRVRPLDRRPSTSPAPPRPPAQQQAVTPTEPASRP